MDIRLNDEVTELRSDDAVGSLCCFGEFSSIHDRC